MQKTENLITTLESTDFKKETGRKIATLINEALSLARESGNEDYRVRLVPVTTKFFGRKILQLSAEKSKKLRVKGGDASGDNTLWGDAFAVPVPAGIDEDAIARAYEIFLDALNAWFESGIECPGTAFINTRLKNDMRDFVYRENTPFSVTDHGIKLMRKAARGEQLSDTSRRSAMSLFAGAVPIETVIEQDDNETTLSDVIADKTNVEDTVIESDSLERLLLFVCASLSELETRVFLSRVLMDKSFSDIGEENGITDKEAEKIFSYANKMLAEKGEEVKEEFV